MGAAGFPNTDPVYSRAGDIDGGCILTAAANDYTGASVNNLLCFSADENNGGFVKKLRFKALGANVATVCRIYLVKVGNNLVTTLAAPAGTPTGTPSTTGGSLNAGTYYAKIYARDMYGKITAASTETAAVTITGAGTTGSITWNWTASSGATDYIVSIGQVTNGQREFHIATTNSLLVTAISILHSPINEGTSPFFIGEISLPLISAASATSAMADIDYMIGEALGADTQIYVGLGTAVAAGWSVTVFAGKY